MSGTATCSTTATSDSLPGTYPIQCAQGSLSAKHSTFTFVEGTLTITERLLALTYTGDTEVTAVGEASTIPLRLAAHLTADADHRPDDLTGFAVQFRMHPQGNLDSPPTHVVGPVPLAADGSALAWTTLPVGDWTVVVDLVPPSAAWEAEPAQATLTVAAGAGPVQVVALRVARGPALLAAMLSGGTSGGPRGTVQYLFQGEDRALYQVTAKRWPSGALTLGATPGHVTASGPAVVERLDPRTGRVRATFQDYWLTIDLIDGNQQQPRQRDAVALTVLDPSGAVWHHLPPTGPHAWLSGSLVTVQQPRR